jgi:hypothetical protein
MCAKVAKRVCGHSTCEATTEAEARTRIVSRYRAIRKMSYGARRGTVYDDRARVTGMIRINALTVCSVNPILLVKVHSDAPKHAQADVGR